ncbi:MAG: NADH-quinone oxidoreductase subunit H [Planctomycetaceae bacterium]|nr:NADH-quinone oxidoreductase subunit H [Planctomycetaceae bacterium]
MMATLASIVHILVALSLAPLLPAVIHRIKAWVAGRRGSPMLQTYRDLWKLLQRGTVISRTTTGLIVVGPVVGLACVAAALTIVPLGGVPGLLTFSGDFLLMAYLFGLMRFVTILAALDTGSSFEGMGASREAFFSALAEPALLLGLAALIAPNGYGSLSTAYASVNWAAMTSPVGPAWLLVAAALIIVFLAENARIPVDDPNTHLELTMIHEAMVLDHGGPDLAMIQYAASLKLWTLGALIVGLLVPVRSGWWCVDLAAGVAGQFALAAVVGAIESTIARLRLVRVPQFLVAASVLSILALVLVTRQS